MKKRGPVRQFDAQVLVPMKSKTRDAIEYRADSEQKSMATVVRESIDAYLQRESAEERCPEELDGTTDLGRVTLVFRSGPDKAGFLKYERVGFPLVYLPARIFTDPHEPPYEIALNGPGLLDRPISPRTARAPEVLATTVGP